MELLPCPFCGGTDVSVEEGSTFRWAVAICNNCDAAAPEARAIHGDKKKTQEAALTEWNRRASPASAPEGFTMSEPAILPDGSGFGTMTEREATLLGKVERQSAALKLAREALFDMQDSYAAVHGWKDSFVIAATTALAAIDALKGE